MGFGEFPPTPQIMRQPQPSSRIRFADDTKPSAREYYDNNISLRRRDNISDKTKQVLVLGGDGSGGQSRQQHTPHHNNNPLPSKQNNRIMMSSSTPSASQANNTLDFSMIATPGGQRLARVMVNDETGSYTTSESSSHFATPFTNMLRGVVSSTPGILTSATEASKYNSKNENNVGNNKNNNNNDDEEECTAITFAKSAPHSGYLKKLGKNIHSFKRRFFVLKPSTHLYYFMSPNDVEPRGCIDLDNFVEGSGGGGCQVNEIGVLPDGTFRFELVFEEEEQNLNDARLDDGDDNILETKNSSSSQRIVLEARTEEIGREWISKIKSERLSIAKGQVDQLSTSLEKSEAARAQWEETASDEKRRANEAEVSRNVAIAEAKSWEGRFRDLNEAILLLVRDTSMTSEVENDSGESSSTDFLRDSLQGLELNGTNYGDVSDAFQRLRDDYNETRKKKEYANETIIKLQQRLEEAEERVTKAESELTQVQENARAMQNDLKRVKREKKILVKEVKTLHENRRQQEIENNNLRQHQLDQQSNNAPSIKSNEDQRRLILELEEHVMSGLRLSEQFLHLNGIDPSEVGDFDSSIQTSSKASDISPLRRRRIPAVIRAKPEILGDDIDSIQASSKASDMSPLRQMHNKTNVSPLARLSQSNATLQRNHQMSNLLDDDDDEEEAGEEELEPSETQVTSRSDQDDISKPEAQSGDEESVKQNLNEIFAEEPQREAFEQATIQPPKQKGTTNDASSSTKEVASVQSLESARSKITDNGHATTRLVKDPQDARSQSSSTDPTDSDGGVYHITFYRKRLGLQFQKVPNEMGTTTGLLTDVLMTADGLDAPETSATELQRIASLSQHSKNRGNNPEMESILPVSPVDAVIVCGFIGFDDSSGSIRPKVGARLVAFDGIPVEVGRWTFESIRKAIQARSRPLTLSFRNDTLSPKQQDILKKALSDIAAASPQYQSIPANPQYNLPRPGSRGESHHQYLDEQSLAAASTESSTTSSQRSRFKKHYSFSETGSSISSAVAPLVSNLMKKSTKQQQQLRHQQQSSEPEYVRRQPSSHDQMRLDEFRSSML